MQFTQNIDFDLLQTKSKPTLLFKHSTQCSISAMALGRVERQISNLSENMDVFFVDVIGNRPLSNEIAEKFSITHESPQVLLIDRGKVVYHASHNAIRPEDILTHA